MCQRRHVPASVAFHPWWIGFGTELDSGEQLTPAAARQFVAAVEGGAISGVRIVGLRQSAEMSHAAVQIEIDVERPQDLAYPIRATEPVAVFFPFGSEQSRIFALRDDFPDTPHQNWTPKGTPCSLCVDDRPWSEARLTSTAPDLIRRIQLWLAKAARGDLHDAAQPPDPLFYLSSLAIVMPPAALAARTEPLELVGMLRKDNPSFIFTRPLTDADRGIVGGGFVVLTYQLPPQAMTRLRHAPTTLSELADELSQRGIDLIADLQARLKTWGGLSKDELRRLEARLAIVVAIPVTAAGNTANDLRAFVTHATAGEVGAALGVLLKNVGAGYVHAIGGTLPQTPVPIKIEPVQVHLNFNRELATSIAGNAVPDRKRAVLVGAGAIGSHMAVNLAREGRFAWTVIDDEYLLPHNMGRHALLSGDVGAPKALALAHHLGAMFGETFTGIEANVLNPLDKAAGDIALAFADADIIIDASASVAVSRYLVDLEGTNARRVAAFFNPAGTAVVVLAERADRSITLSDLEAQYHRLVLTEPTLPDHFDVSSGGIRYSGSCRTLTNRIPATRAALLSAIAARGIGDSVSQVDASIKIWTTADDGQTQLVTHIGAPVQRFNTGAWTISYNDDLMADLSRLREQKLPDETGGVMLGIVDVSRQSIHLAHAMPPPQDSHGTPTGFERGVVGLLDEINRAVERSMHQLRYIGEWHSHPRLSSPWPSATDLTQLAWLQTELASEGLPGLMAIAADNGKFSFVIGSE